MQEISALERKIQENCLEFLQILGYEYIEPKLALKLRKNNANVLLEDILLQKLEELNSYEYKGQNYKFSHHNILRAVKDLDCSLNEGLMWANEKITDLLLSGTSYEEILPDGTKRSQSFKFIDFENIDNNAFHLSQEFEVAKISGTKGTRRPDLVLFINGIPLVVIELKRGSKSCENAIKQLLSAQNNDEIPQLFKFAQITLASNGHDTKYGTTQTTQEFYSTWKEEQKQDLTKLIKDRTPSELDESLISLLSKERLLRLIKHYIFFDKKIKKICRHQQFFAIEKTLQRVENLQNNIRTGGLIWHTQGSGKSLTMVMLAKLLKQKYANAKIIIVTDRVDLDEQIHKTFKGADTQIARAWSGEDLIQKLQSGKSVISTLVHKFEKARECKVSLKDNNIFVLTDEAHRSQSGDLHNAMKRVLPNACYIAFTGTPLLKKEKNSFVKFGGEIHRYTINDAIKDKAIVPLFYESRVVEQKVLDENGLLQEFDRITKNLNESEKKALQAKWVKDSKIKSSEQRLHLIASNISKHFEDNFKNTGFKAMFATSSKYEAICYHQIFEKYTDIKSAYIISSNEAEELESGDNKEFVAKAWRKTLEKYGNEKNYFELCIKKEFVDGDDIELLIVVDKLLTGFDAPKVAVLYVDKPLKEHNLLQAIARANRLYEGKDYGLIVDYRGILGDLNEALTSYTALEGFDLEDLTGAIFDIKSEIIKLRKYDKNLEELFKEVRFKDDKESFITALQNPEKRVKFKENLSLFARTLKLALGSTKINEVLSDEEIKEFKQKANFYNEIRKELQLRNHENFDFGVYEAQMQKLLDNYVGTNGIYTLPKLVDIFDSKFDEQMQSLENENAKADTILSASRSVIAQKMETNPAFYKNIAQQIEELIEAYKEKRISEEGKLRKAEEIRLRLVSKKLEKDYPKEFEEKENLCALYDNVKIFFKAVNLSSKDQMLIDLVLKIDTLYAEKSKKPEWWDNEDIEKEITNALDDFFWDLKIQVQNFEELCEVVRGIEISFYKDK